MNIPPPATAIYTNWRGETAVRRLIPKAVWFGTTEWHETPTWLLRALDADAPEKGERDYDLLKCCFTADQSKPLKEK